MLTKFASGGRNASSTIFRDLLAATTEQEILTLIVRAAPSLCFESSRYYDTNYCPIRQENYYTLRIAEPECAQLYVGESIKDATLDKATDSLLGVTYVIDHDDGKERPSEDTTNWLNAIPLWRKTWIDVEITLSQRRIGLWALSRAYQDTISRDDIEAIATIARLASMRLTELADNARWQFLKSFKHSDLTAGLKYIGELADAASVAYFDLNITTGQLRKHIELVRHPNGTWRELDNKYRETYVLGEHLTGAAWFEEKLHYIPFFHHLIEDRPELVSKGSLDFHEEILEQKVTTVLYELIDYPGAPRGLVRLINRFDLPSFPFSSQHSQTLALGTQHLSQFLATLEIAQKIEASWTQYFEALAEIQGTKIPYLAISKSLAKLGIHSASQTVIDANSEIVEHWNISQRRTERIDSFKGKSLRRETLAPLRRPGIYRIANAPSSVADFAKNLNSHYVYARMDSSRNSAVLTMFGIVSSDVHGDAVARELERIWKDSPHQQRLLDGFSFCLTSIFELVSARSQASLNNLAVGRISHDLLRPTNRMQNIAQTVADLLKASVSDALLEKLTYLDLDRTTNQFITRRFANSSELTAQINSWMFELQSNYDEAYSIIQTAFSWARLESGKSGLNLSLVNLGELLERSIDQLQTVLLSKPFAKIEIDHSAKSIAPFYADRDLLRTLCVNLLDNAIKYSHRRDRGRSIIHVTAETSRESLAMRFTNWGLGILERDYDKVFESYVRRSLNDPLESYSGAGLGLSTCKKIVEAHGGEISVESVATLNDIYKTKNQKGYLTTFTVRLPLNLTARED